MMTRDEFKLLITDCADLGQILKKCGYDMGVTPQEHNASEYDIWYADGSVLHITLYSYGMIDFYFQSNWEDDQCEDYFEWSCRASWRITEIR